MSSRWDSDKKVRSKLSGIEYATSTDTGASFVDRGILLPNAIPSGSLHKVLSLSHKIHRTLDLDLDDALLIYG